MADVDGDGVVGKIGVGQVAEGGRPVPGGHDSTERSWARCTTPAPGPNVSPVPPPFTRPVVVMADGPDGPLPDPRSVHLVAGLEDPDIVLGWVTRTPAWLDDGHRVTTLMTGVGTRDAVRSGAIRSVPTRLSAIPRILGGWMRPTVAVVSAVRDGRAWRFAPNVGWAPEAARFAERVVIEVAPLTGSLARRRPGDTLRRGHRHGGRSNAVIRPTRRQPCGRGPWSGR